MLDTKTLLRETQDRIAPPKDLMGSLERRRQRNDRNRRVAAGVLGIAVFALAAIGFVRLLGSERTPASDPRSPFLGVWVSNDADGSERSMIVRASGDGAVEITVADELATVCSDSPSTMTGTGRVEGGTQLVIPAPVYTCDDGSEPQDATGPPLEGQLRNLTFILDPAAETLKDNFGQVWTREGAPDPSPERTISSQAWPQSTLEDAQRAQELADAGDPDYAWQLGPGAEFDPGTELFDRFLRDRLGWEEFLRVNDAGATAGVYVRCAPGRTNPLYPNDPQGGGCAPTIDRFRYETVKVNVSQPLHNSPSGGIWVVTAWATLQPSDTPTYIDDPFRHQVEQVAPPSDAEATEFLSAFLQARVAGEGAERYLHPQAEQVVAEGACSVHTSASCSEIPLLYATTSGAPYERFELELVEGPGWPFGLIEFDIRLFAEGGSTVVEQPFLLVGGADGGLGLVYETLSGGAATTQNGEAVGLPYELLDGDATLFAPGPWYEFFDYGPGTIALVHGDLEGGLSILADPLPVGTGCEPGPAPADARVLARSIRSDPDLEATQPVAVGVGGIQALRMDVVAAAGASVCDSMGQPLVLKGPSEEARPMGPSLGQGDRMRLYLLDLPVGASARILAIAIEAPKASFERVVDAAAPILDSFEFQTR